MLPFSHRTAFAGGSLRGCLGLVVVASCWLGGCAGGASPPQLTASTGTTTAAAPGPSLEPPAAADVSTASLIPAALTSLPSVLTKSDRVVSTSTTETYALVARGATRCWFGRGPLRQSHIFHADAEPTEKGGRAIIAIQERDPASADPRGAKAYRIEIVANPSGGAIIEQENLRLTPAIGEAMRADVARWANGNLACSAWPDVPAVTAKTAGAPVLPAETSALATAAAQARNAPGRVR